MPNWNLLINSWVACQPVYQPGKPVDLVAREFGLNPAEVVKLASNENPLGCSPKAKEAVAEAMHEIHRYPDGGAYHLHRALAQYLEMPPDAILLGNGSNEILMMLGQVFLGPEAGVVVGDPAFVVYQLAALSMGAPMIKIPLESGAHALGRMAAAIDDRTRLVFLASPNNPTGGINAPEAILEFLKDLPDHVVAVVDEAYFEYLETPPDIRPLIREGRKVFGVRTFSKIHGLAGLRLGYLYGDPDAVALLERIRQPFNVNSLAQAAAVAALEDFDFIERSRLLNQQGLLQLTYSLGEKGFSWIPTEANFLLIHVPKAEKVAARLLQNGIIVRPMTGYGLPDHLRVSVGTLEENQRFLAEFFRC